MNDQVRAKCRYETGSCWTGLSSFFGSLMWHEISQKRAPHSTEEGRSIQCIAAVPEGRFILLRLRTCAYTDDTIDVNALYLGPTPAAPTFHVHVGTYHIFFHLNCDILEQICVCNNNNNDNNNDYSPQMRHQNLLVLEMLIIHYYIWPVFNRFIFHFLLNKNIIPVNCTSKLDKFHHFF